MNDHKKQAKILHEQMKASGDIQSEQKLAEFLSAYEGSDKIVSSKDLTAQIEELENEARYKTGIESLDQITDGFRSNQLVVIGSAPKSGKTQFSVELAKRIQKESGEKCTMFLFEETAPEVLYKYKKKGIELPDFLTPAELIEYNIDSVYRKMIEAWAKYDSKIFFIDHLHFLLGNSKRLDLDIKDVMQELKKFAKMHGFTIFLITHLKMGNFMEPPGVDAIRDSSFIAQYADTVIMLWREIIQAGTDSHSNVTKQTKNMLANVILNRKINFVTDDNTGLVELTFNTDNWTYEEFLWYGADMEEEQQEKTQKKEKFSRIQS